MNNVKNNTNKENMIVDEKIIDVFTNEEYQIKEVTFNINVEKEGKSEDISFKNQVYPDGTTGNGESYNPTSGWTHWHGWNQGWQEQDV